MAAPVYLEVWGGMVVPLPGPCQEEQSRGTTDVGLCWTCGLGTAGLCCTSGGGGGGMPDQGLPSQEELATPLWTAGLCCTSSTPDAGLCCVDGPLQSQDGLCCAGGPYAATAQSL